MTCNTRLTYGGKEKTVKLIRTTGVKTSLSKLTTNERKVQYEQLAEQSNIELSIIHSFLDLLEQQQNDLIIDSTLPSLKLKQIIKYAQPIVSDDSSDITSKNTILIELPYPCKTITKNGQFYRVYAANTIIPVIGYNFLNIQRGLTDNYPGYVYDNTYITNIGLYNNQMNNKYVAQIMSLYKLQNVLFTTDEKQNTILLNNTLSIIKQLNNKIQQFTLLNTKLDTKIDTKLVSKIDTKIDTKEILPRKLTSDELYVSQLYNGAVNLNGHIINYDMPNELYHLLRYIQINGRSNKYAMDQYNQIKTINDVIASYKQLQIKIRESSIKYRQLNNIAFKYFNHSYYNLNESQKKEVQTIYKQINQTINTQNNQTIYNPQDIALLHNVEERHAAYKRLQKAEKDSNIPLSDIICDHIIYQLNSKLSAIQLERHVITEFSSTSTVLRGHYYCKLCGEQLYPIHEEDQFDRHSVTFTELSDDEKHIWSMTKSIYDKYVIQLSGNPNIVIQHITSVVNHSIFDILNDTRVIKNENKRDTIQTIYMSTYIFAAIIHVILTYKISQFKNTIADKAQNNKIDRKKKTTDKNKLDTFNTAIQLLVQHISSQMKDASLTVEQIKKQLVVAYHEITQQINLKEVSNIHCELASNPVLKWYSTINNIDISKAVSLLISFDENVSLYKRVDIKNNPHWNLLNEYLHNELYLDTVIPMSNRLTEYHKSVDMLSHSYIKDKQSTIIKSFYPPFKSGESRKFRIYPVDISQRYDIDGLRIKWANFVMSINGKKKIYTKQELNSLIGTKEYLNMKFIEYQSTNGVLQSKTNLKQVVKARELKVQLDNFYEYYTYRCPISSIHDFNDKDQCKKCKITYDIIKTKNVEYFQKWNNTFINRLQIISYPTIDTKLSKSDPSKFTMTTNAILNVSRQFKIPFNVLYNLGLTENYFISDLINGAINPAENDEINISRAYKLKGYYLYFVQYINLLINYKQVSKLPYDLNKVLSNHNLEKINVTLIPPIPSLSNEYVNHNVYLSNYILNQLFNQIDGLINSSVIKKVNGLSNVLYDVLQLILQNIINKDSMLSMYQIIKIKAQEKTTDEVEVDESLEEGAYLYGLDNDNNDEDENFVDVTSSENVDFDDWDNVEGTQDF